ncbi:McrC family protein [Bradyrhizobium elkanii]|uniref:McrC family protein n=1 Tax=Bradyrhizobium elkanii TaxID=29448 RepID=UPI00351324C9
MTIQMMRRIWPLTKPTMLKSTQSDIEITPVTLNEWDRVEAVARPQLLGTTLRSSPSAQKMTDAIRSQVDIREGYKGLEVSTTSFVGYITVGPLRININPKLQGLPLTVLVRYAYGLRDLEVLGPTLTPMMQHGLHDILISLLIAEIEELLHRGLQRRYIPVSEKLASPRGRILVEKIAFRGGVLNGTLPCLHFQRHSNWKLNQVLRSGLYLAGNMTVDRELHRRVRRLADAFDAVDTVAIQQGDLDEVERGLTRLTATSKPALTLIRLLSGMYGTSIETETSSSRTPGFLFDMNYFFQRLLSRFLRENLDDLSIKDELATKGMFAYAAHGNPKGRPLPRPRPDFALYNAKDLIGFLDAKYRDVWVKGYPASWLYQLSMYALASPNQKSILLYGTTSSEARDERICIRHSVLSRAGSQPEVIVRPVQLQTLAMLLEFSKDASAMREQRKCFARSLVAF